MATLQVYEMLVKKPAKEISKAPTVTDELPDETNLIVVDGVLCINDTTNGNIVSIQTIIRELDKLSEMMFVQNGSSSDTVFALYNFFEQLKDEYE